MLGLSKREAGSVWHKLFLMAGKQHEGGVRKVYVVPELP